MKLTSFAFNVFTVFSSYEKYIRKQVAKDMFWSKTYIWKLTISFNCQIKIVLFKKKISEKRNIIAVTIMAV